MKVLLMTCQFPPHPLGGYELLCSSVARGLQERGHPVEVLTSRGGEAAARERMVGLQPDVILLWSQLRLSAGQVRVAQASGRTVAWSLNDASISGQGPGLSFRHATCVSRSLRESLVRAGVPVADARVIPPGVPLDRFALKADLGTVHGPLRLLFVGALQWDQGPHTFVRAAHWLAARGLRVRATLVGDGFGAYDELLRREASGGAAEVVFAGRIPHAELADVYHQHDIFVFPSIRDEPFGLALLEAMACGLPVVSTVDGGHVELVEVGVNALAFRPDDTEDLARQIGRLALNARLRSRLARGGRATVEQGFRFERYLDEIEDFLLQAARMEPQPRLAEAPPSQPRIEAPPAAVPRPASW